MEEVEKYRRFVQEVLSDIAKIKDVLPEIETQLIFDTKRDHYQIVRIGWRDLDRTYGVPIHIDIKDGKIWIQQNMTDYDFIEDLLEKGIPKEDIVLAFHPPYKRPYTGFGVGA